MYDDLKSLFPAEPRPRVISRYGGKGRSWKLYEPVIRDLAKQWDCDTFVDLFGGAGTCSFGASMMKGDYNKHVFNRVTYNELELAVVTLLRVVQDPVKVKQLVNKILNTTYSKETFDAVKPFIDDINSGKVVCDDDLLIAWAAYCVYHMSYLSNGRNFRNEGCKVLVDQMFKRAKTLTDVSMYLQSIELRHGDYKDTLIEFSQNPKALLFLDPPYMPVERSVNAEKVYHHEMTNVDHLVLVEQLSHCHRWILCGYRKAVSNPVYEKLEQIEGVKRVDLGKVYKASSKHKTYEHEYIWIRP